MITVLGTLLALWACNPPIDTNEGPAIKFEQPEDGAVLNANEPIEVQIRLVDRDGEEPMSLTLTSSANGLVGEATDMANFDVATFLITDPVSGEHSLTAESLDSKGATQTKVIEFSVNGTPSAPTLALTPADPTTADNLSGSVSEDAIDPEGAPLVYSWAWTNLGAGQVFTGEVLPAVVHSSFTERGDTWEFAVTTFEAVEIDGVLAKAQGGISFATTASTIILNSPPTAPGGVVVNPALPSPIDDLYCTVTGSTSDVDGDAISFDYSWELDDAGTWTVVAAAATLDAAQTEGDETYRCVARAYDGIDYGTEVTSQVVVGPAFHGADSGSILVSGSGKGRFIGEIAAGAALDAAAAYDLLLGFPDASDFETDGGWVAIFDGPPTSGVTELANTRSLGGTSGLFFGSPLLPIADANGDGQPDVLIGAAGDAGTLSPIVLLAPGGSLTASHTSSDTAGLGFVTLLHGDPTAEDGFGQGIAAGDVDGSGEADIFVAQLRVGAKNKVYIFLDQELSPNTSVTTDSATTIAAGDSTQDFGQVLVSGADVTGDGLDDLIVSNPTQTSGKAIYVFSGSQLGTSNISAGSAQIRIATDGDYGAGESLALADINGDGVADIVVGAPRYNSSGAVFIFYGGAALPATPDLQDADILILGEHAGDEFGAQVQALADRGADGMDELLVSAPGADSASGALQAGRVYAYLGSGLSGGAPSVDASSADLVVSGEDVGDALHLSGTLGDLDGDGYDDWLTVSPTHGDVDNNEGRVYLFLSGY
jgi:hypothetical protein